MYTFGARLTFLPGTAGVVVYSHWLSSMHKSTMIRAPMQRNALNRVVRKQRDDSAGGTITGTCVHKNGTVYHCLGQKLLE